MVRFLSPIIESNKKIREGKGFSLDELKAVDLTAGRAKQRGIPVDTRRNTSHQENIDVLIEFLEEAEELEIKVSKPKFTNKPIAGRAFRGKTSAGKKMRYLSRRK